MAIGLICQHCEVGFSVSPSLVRRWNRRFCTAECRRAWEISPARFWANVEKTDGCWLWRASTFRKGRGQFKVHGKNWLAPRYSWFITHGSVPDELMVCHDCDNGLCVRPDHLFLGTHIQNMEDMVVKGRAARGSLSPKARMNEEQVRIILAYCAEDRSNARRQEIATRLGMSLSAISHVVYRRNWLHVSAES